VSAIHRIFIDSNVLFSASLVPNHPFLSFWNHANARAVLSTYVVEEVVRNTVRPGHRRRLEELLRKTEVVEGRDIALPTVVELPEKDQPIFAHAIAAGVRFLVTGDKTHFGRYFNQTFETQSGPLTVMEPTPLLLFLEDLE
jgi:predicted nucleic acid-binding protein